MRAAPQIASQGAAHLFFEQSPDAVAIGGELRTAAHVERARPRQVDRDRLDDAAGRGAHDADAVGEIDRFVDVVGDEDDRLAVALPDLAATRRAISWRICASSAPNGSSISRISGSTHRARAIPTRWRIPPESWCGNAPSKSRSPTFAMCSRARARRSSTGDAFELEPELDVAQHRAPRQQREILKDERAIRARASSTGVPLRRIVPDVGRCNAAISISRLLFPQPLGPTTVTSSPRSTARSIAESARNDEPSRAFGYARLTASTASWLRGPTPGRHRSSAGRGTSTRATLP